MPPYVNRAMHRKTNSAPSHLHVASTKAELKKAKTTGSVVRGGGRLYREVMVKWLNEPWFSFETRSADLMSSTVTTGTCHLWYDSVISCHEDDGVRKWVWSFVVTMSQSIQTLCYTSQRYTLFSVKYMSKTRRKTEWWYTFGGVDIKTLLLQQLY